MTRAELRDLIAEVLDVAPSHAADVLAALDAIPAEELAEALGLEAEVYVAGGRKFGTAPQSALRIVRKRGRP